MEDTFKSAIKDPLLPKGEYKNQELITTNDSVFQKVEFKIVIIGPTCGKTQFVCSYCNKQKPDKMTIGYEFSKKIVTKEFEKMEIHIHFFDTMSALKDEHLQLKSLLFTSDCAIVFYDITSKSSFADLKEKYLPLIPETSQNGFRFPILIIGNKIDLCDERTVTYSEVINSVGKDPRVIGIKEASSLTGVNVERSMNIIIEHMLKNRLYSIINNDNNSKKKKKISKWCCC